LFSCCILKLVWTYFSSKLDYMTAVDKNNVIVM